MLPGHPERRLLPRRRPGNPPPAHHERLTSEEIAFGDDRPAFEQALVTRLTEHRQSLGSDPAPRTLLPLGPLALAALAVHVHGWELNIRTGYLPHSILGSPQALQEAVAADGNGPGGWAAEERPDPGT
ncbi:Imm49 family immunity protein [Streptomyces syringium]|uniref:Imm49 family immunity protein n=1 Tax=Streptomyces syringium TaxID=76729 RepID=UPI003655EACC